MSARFSSKPSDDDALEGRAAAWFAQRDAGLTPTEQREFDAWLASDPRHREALHRLEQTWSHLAQLHSYRPDARGHPDRDLLAPSRRRKAVSFSQPVWTLAAAAMLSFAALWWWVRQPAPLTNVVEPGQTYATTAGGFERVTLPDGSVVELNANSAFHARFGPDERRVALVRGEAHFTVAKDEARPFRVEASGIQVRAVGTAFAVRRAARDVEVIVTAGTVKVERRGSADDAAESTRSPILTAGWRAVVPAVATEETVVEKISPEQLRVRLAWQSSRLVFVDMPLAEVVQQFNQRNDVQLEISEPALGAMPVGGSFEAENVDTFVRLLTSNGDIVAERLSSQRILLRRAR